MSLWNVAPQAPLSMGLSLQECWNALPFPPPRNPPQPGMESASPALAGGFFTTEPPGMLVVTQQYMAEPREAIFKVSAIRFQAGLLASPEALCTSLFVQKKKRLIISFLVMMWALLPPLGI